VRALVEAVRFIYTYDEDSIALNLYTTSAASITLRNKTVRVTQEVDSPVGPVRIALYPEGAHLFTLHIRIPAWAKTFRLTLNRETVTPETAPGRVSIRRIWQPGDILEIDWEPVLRLIPDTTNGFSAAEAVSVQEPAKLLERTALAYGPWVLMLDPSLNIYDMFEWDKAEIIVPQSAAGEPFLAAIAAPILGRGEFAVPSAGFMTLARRRDGEPVLNLEDAAWKLAFLVPISELADRWTYSLSRLVPYEVRNDVRLLDPAGVEGYLSRLHSCFNAFVQQRQSDTAVETA
jgi:hypothetical protein